MYINIKDGLPKKSGYYCVLLDYTTSPFIMYYSKKEEGFGDMRRVSAYGEGVWNEWVWDRNVSAWSDSVPKRPKWHKELLKSKRP